MRCRICNQDLGPPIYEGPPNKSITSLSELVDYQTRVWLCSNCSHLSSQDLPNIVEFYDNSYNISMNDTNEDQIYSIDSGVITYRNQHQLRTLLEKVVMKDGWSVLDYGCAKGAMAKALATERPDISISLFDVSDNYRSQWSFVADETRKATYKLPQSWSGSFDLVTLFFVIEHIENPTHVLSVVRSLLSQGGLLYAIIPYTLTNIGDLVVVDHVNHFTTNSIRYALTQSGFTSIECDTKAHRGAIVVTARKDEEHRAATNEPRPEYQHAQELGSYWYSANQLLRAGPATDEPTAIYGAGFYGSYIYASIGDQGPIRCFVDRSPYLQGRTHLGIPVLAPEALPEDIHKIYIGLNPLTALADQLKIAEGLPHKVEPVTFPAWHRA